MNRSFWLAALAYLVPTFPLGYFWHLVFFADRYHALAMYRDEVIIPLGLASMVDDNYLGRVTTTILAG